MKRIYTEDGVLKFKAVIQHDLACIWVNPFRALTLFANMPLLDNEFMNPAWYNIIFPSNRFNNHRLWIKINDL